MKKVFVVVFAFLFLTLNQALAYNVKDYSSDPTILSALRLLEQSGETDVFANLERNDVKIKFQALSSYGQTVYLDNWSTSADGYIWGRYTAYSGATRYVAVRTTSGEAYLTL